METNNSIQPVFKSAAHFRLAKKISQKEGSLNIETTPSQLQKKNSIHVLTCSSKTISANIDIYYISQIQKNRGNNNSAFMKHLTSSFNILKRFQNIQGSQYVQTLNMPQHQKYYNKKTLILDLDQTIIHSTKLENVPCDFRVTMNFPKGKVINAGIKLRPFAMQFLKNISKSFQIIVFTASHHYYADPILDALDPTRTLFSYRLYQQHCIQIQKDTFVKDLRMIPRLLSQMILVDNSPVSYLFQLQNGIPITSFYEQYDEQLKSLEHYLMKLAYLVDIKNMNQRTFKLSKYKQFQTIDTLIDSLYYKN